MLIRTRLILIGLLPLLLLLLFIVGAMVTQRHLDSLKEKAVIADNLGKTLFNLTVVAHDLEKNISDRPGQQWSTIIRELKLQLPKAKEIYSSADESELLETLLDYSASSQRNFQELIQFASQHQGQALNMTQQNYLISLRERLYIDLQSAIPIANKISGITQKTAASYAEKRSNIMIAALIFLAGVILLILWPLMRSITRSIENLKFGMHQVALGDLELRIEATGEDELAQLARHFNKMTSKLAEVTVARELLSAEVVERKQTENALRYSERRFRDVSDAAGEYLWEINANMVYTYVSNRSADVKGYSPEELLGHTPMEFMPEEDIAPVGGIVNRAIANKAPFKLQHRDITKSGAILWEEVNGVPFYDDNGAVAGLRGAGLNITQRKLAEAEINNLAFYDPLTQLPNRRLLMDRIKQALASSDRSGLKGAILFIDLDNFKTLNDTLGHDVGDQLLQQVAQRLESCVREGDTVSRLGGDEFVVMLEDLSEQALDAASQAEIVGDKILATLNQPYQLAEHSHHSTPSIGVTIFSGHEQNQDELLKQADIAMYQAKKAGRNTLRFFDPQMQDTISARALLESDLRRSVAEQEQFQLYYQVQVDSAGSVFGAEALLRWLHPGRGMVSPLDFIPLAEESGLILPLGHWVLSTACQQLKAWAGQPETENLTLAVNVSVKQFNLPTFVEEVLALIDYFKIDPTRLKLEITESMLLSNVNDIVIKMTALKVMGIKFSIDDFGTGYSSLQYLKLLPLDQLKIDQSFVRELTSDSSDKAIVRTIIAMAESLNLNVIAEGVETEEQRQILLKKGCTKYQGYLFGRPMPIEQFEAVMKQGDL